MTVATCTVFEIKRDIDGKRHIIIGFYRLVFTVLVEANEGTNGHRDT